MSGPDFPYKKARPESPDIRKPEGQPVEEKAAEIFICRICGKHHL